MTAPKPGEWLKKEAASATAATKGVRISEAQAQEAEVEHWLKRFGVKYSRCLDIPLSGIDEKESRRNQARADALVEDSVNRFAQALKEGQSLPPIVVRSVGGKAVIIDGNNREAAHRRVQADTVRGFIVHPDTPTETILLMTVDANAHHGVTPDLSWRLKQAQHLTTLGFSAEQAAEHAAVTRTQLISYQRQLKATERAARLRIMGFDRLPAVHKTALGVLQLEAVFAAASGVVIATQMTGEETQRFVKEIKACSSEATQLEFIAKTRDNRLLEAQRVAMSRRPVAMRSYKQALITGVGKILNADAEGVASQVLTDVERGEMVRRLVDARSKLDEIIEVLEPSKEARNAG